MKKFAFVEGVKAFAKAFGEVAKDNYTKFVDNAYQKLHKNDNKNKSSK